MNTFDPHFLIPASLSKDDALKLVRLKIAAWISSSYFLDLLKQFGGELPHGQLLDKQLRYLEQFSELWDFRRLAREQGVATDDDSLKAVGAARWLTGKSGLDPQVAVQVMKDVDGLGLVRASRPSSDEYDFVLVLGGARLACLRRAELAAELIRTGIRTKMIGILGTARPVTESEREATDTYAFGAQDEFDLMLAGAQQAFGLKNITSNEKRFDDETNRNLSWKINHLNSTVPNSSTNLVAISAPSSDPMIRRANSIDTIRFFIDSEHVDAGKRILLVTGQIYAPYVQLEALREVAIPRRIEVETIGVSRHRHSDNASDTEDSTEYLQEVRSTIQAARRFCLEFPT